MITFRFLIVSNFVGWTVAILVSGSILNPGWIGFGAAAAWCAIFFVSILAWVASSRANRIADRERALVRLRRPEA